jgi:hypothetical protein
LIPPPLLWCLGPHASIPSPCFSADRAPHASTTAGLLPAAYRLLVGLGPSSTSSLCGAAPYRPPTPLLHTTAPFKTAGHCTHAPLFSPWHAFTSRTTCNALPSPLLLVQPSTPEQAEIGRIVAAPALSSPSSVSTATDRSLSNLSQAHLSTTPPGVIGTDCRRYRPPVRHRHVGTLPPHSPILAGRVTETSPVLVPVTSSHGSRLHVPIGHAAASALRAVIACARAHATPLALGVLDHFWSLSGPTMPGLGPDLALALLLGYSFLKFVFHLKFPVN